MKSGICKLCLTQSELEHSHILSELLYRASYDEKHVFLGVSIDPKERTKRHQKGLREYLLCGACEDRLCRHETYVARLLSQIEARQPSGEEPMFFEYSYPHLKLFGLSLLWRAHVSTLSMAKGVDLGTDAAETIRQMLLTDCPGGVGTFPFSMTKLTGSEVALRIVQMPHRCGAFSEHHIGFNAIELRARGIDWRFTLSSQFPIDANARTLVGYDPEHLMVPVRELNEDFQFIMVRRWLETHDKLP